MVGLKLVLCRNYAVVTVVLSLLLCSSVPVDEMPSKSACREFNTVNTGIIVTLLAEKVKMLVGKHENFMICHCGAQYLDTALILIKHQM